MKRVIVIPSEYQENACYQNSLDNEEAPLILNHEDYSRVVIKEWMYASQGLVVYDNPDPRYNATYWIDFAAKIGIPISRRSLDGTIKDNQDPE